MSTRKIVVMSLSSIDYRVYTDVRRSLIKTHSVTHMVMLIAEWNRFIFTRLKLIVEYNPYYKSWSQSSTICWIRRAINYSFRHPLTHAKIFRNQGISWSAHESLYNHHIQNRHSHELGLQDLVSGWRDPTDHCCKFQKTKTESPVLIGNYWSVITHHKACG